MKRVKKVLLIVALGALSTAVVSCKCSSGQQLEKNLEVSQSAEMVDEYIPDLDSTGFAVNIGAINVDPAEWSYVGSKPAIIEFYADWCGYCKEQHKVFEAVSKRHSKSFNFYRINIDSQPMLADMFDIIAVPTIVYIDSEGKMSMAEGLQSSNQIEKAATALFSKPPKEAEMKSGSHTSVKHKK